MRFVFLGGIVSAALYLAYQLGKEVGHEECKAAIVTGFRMVLRHMHEEEEQEGDHAHAR